MIPWLEISSQKQHHSLPPIASFCGPKITGWASKKPARCNHPQAQTYKKLCLSGKRTRKGAAQQRPGREINPIHTQDSGRLNKLQQQPRPGASRTTHPFTLGSPTGIE